MPDIRAVETTNARPVLTPWVEAAVPYLADLSVKPVTYNPPVGTGTPRRDGNYRDFKVRIHDARPIARDLSLDHQAFILAQHATAGHARVANHGEPVSRPAHGFDRDVNVRHRLG